MKQCAFLFLVASSYSLHAQIIEYAQGRFVDCDSARSTLQLGLCSKYLAERAESEMHSVFKLVISSVDEMSLEDDSLKAKMLIEGVDSASFQNRSDCGKIKDLMIKSHQLFLNRVQLEVHIAGEVVGIGRERSIHENSRMTTLYKLRKEDLLQFLNGR